MKIAQFIKVAQPKAAMKKSMQGKPGAMKGKYASMFAKMEKAQKPMPQKMKKMGK